MRLIALSSPLLLTAALALAAPEAPVDLNRPGVLQQLKESHPQRYQAVTAVLEASERVPCKAGELGVVAARYDLKDLECGVIVFTSYPAKRAVSFELDGTRYAATVTLKDADAALEPAALTAEPAATP